KVNYSFLSQCPENRVHIRRRGLFWGGKKRKTGSSDVKDDGTVVFGDDLRYYKIVEVYLPANRRTYL
uniref:hypothetical protein n=1 Tax=Faecalibacterium prausnitzii TaxID=853 RepID=UPI003FED72B7